MQLNMLKAPGFTWTRFGWALSLLLLVNCGCSGINVSKGISPLDFLLPGLLQNDPPKPLVPSGTNVLVCWDGVAPLAAQR